MSATPISQANGQLNGYDIDTRGTAPVSEGEVQATRSVNRESGSIERCDLPPVPSNSANGAGAAGTVAATSADSIEAAHVALSKAQEKMEMLLAFLESLCELIDLVASLDPSKLSPELAEAIDDFLSAAEDFFKELASTPEPVGTGDAAGHGAIQMGGNFMVAVSVSYQSQSSAKSGASIDDLIAAGRSFNMLGRLMIESANQNYLSERLVTQMHALGAFAASMAAAMQLDKAADKMAAAALTRLITGVIGGAMQIGGGLASMGMAGLGGRSGNKADATGQNPPAGGASPKPGGSAAPGAGAKPGAPPAGGTEKLGSTSGELAAVKANALNSIVSGVAKAGEAGGNYHATIQDVAAEKARAEAKRWEAKAAFINSLREERSSHMQQLGTQLQALIDGIKQVLEADLEALRVTTLRG